MQISVRIVFTNTVNDWIHISCVPKYSA